MSTRNSRIEPLEVQGILQSARTTAAKPSPVEHVASPSSPALSTGSSDRTSFQSHSRTMSTMSLATEAPSAAPRMNRFSLSFPVQLSASTSPVRSTHSPTREAPPVAPEAVAPPTGPTDTSFLTAVATQERRVLELREELAKAEADLNKLKRQWALHEAQQKRNEAKSVTKLQAVQTSFPSTDKEDDSDGSSAWMQQEMERRKALMSGNRSSNRTVFSGSKHTRTLSLLSPVNQAPTQSSSIQRSARPPRKESLSETVRHSQDTERTKYSPATIVRAATTTDLNVDGADTAHSESDYDGKSVDKDLLLQGKKMATELKDGLWTFWEDLRQATVGEEAGQVPPPRHQGSTQTLRTAKKHSSKTSLRPSSRDSATTSKIMADTRKISPARKHAKSTTMSFPLAGAPALADPSFWDGVLLDQQASPATPATVKKAGIPSRNLVSPSRVTVAASNEDEAWDAWDESSPQTTRSSSAASESTTLPSTVSTTTSPRLSSEAPMRSSASQSKKADPIPWPALSNLGPKALRRTASHLMAEWERSLTPSPSKESSDQADYLGLGAEASAAATSRDRR